MAGVELDWWLCAVWIQGNSSWGIYCIVAEPGDVAFIPSVEQNRSSRMLPVFVSHEVSLFEGAILEESKVINLKHIRRGRNTVKG